MTTNRFLRALWAVVGVVSLLPAVVGAVADGRAWWAVLTVAAPGAALLAYVAVAPPPRGHVPAGAPGTVTPADGERVRGVLIPPRRTQLTAGVVSWAGWLVGSAAGVCWAAAEDAAGYLVVAAAAAVGTATGLAAAVRRLRDPARTAVVLAREGVSLHGGRRFVAWDRLEDVTAGRTSSQLGGGLRSLSLRATDGPVALRLEWALAARPEDLKALIDGLAADPAARDRLADGRLP